MNTNKSSLGIFSVPLLIIILMCSSGCKKYENGPWFSLRGTEKRVVNSWCYETVLRNGLDITDGLPELSIVYSKSAIGFNPSKRFTTILHYTDSLNFPPERYDGNWAFSENKEELILTYDPPAPMSGDTQVWFITKLRENAFWTEEDFGANLYEYRMSPSDAKLPQ